MQLGYNTNGLAFHRPDDALRSTLDFSAAVAVPSTPDAPFTPDWSEVAWSAGFDLDPEPVAFQ